MGKGMKAISLMVASTALVVGDWAHAEQNFVPLSRKQEFSSVYSYEEKLGKTGTIDVNIFRRFEDHPEVSGLTEYDQFYPQRIALFRVATVTKESGNRFFQVQKIDVTYNTVLYGMYLVSQNVRYRGKIVDSLEAPIVCKMKNNDIDLCVNYDADDVIKTIGKNLQNYRDGILNMCNNEYKFSIWGTSFLNCVKH